MVCSAAPTESLLALNFRPWFFRRSDTGKFAICFLLETLRFMFLPVRSSSRNVNSPNIIDDRSFGLTAGINDCKIQKVHVKAFFGIEQRMQRTCNNVGYHTVRTAETFSPTLDASCTLHMEARNSRNWSLGMV